MSLRMHLVGMAFGIVASLSLPVVRLLPQYLPLSQLVPMFYCLPQQNFDYWEDKDKCPHETINQAGVIDGQG